MSFVSSDVVQTSSAALASRLSAARAIALDQLAEPRVANLDRLTNLNTTAIPTRYWHSGAVSFTGATIHAPASWVQLFASTAREMTWMFLFVETGNFYQAGVLRMEIGTGAAGSEVVLLPELRWYTDHDAGNFELSMPVRIPQGSRVVLRNLATSPVLMGAHMYLGG